MIAHILAAVIGMAALTLVWTLAALLIDHDFADLRADVRQGTWCVFQCAAVIPAHLAEAGAHRAAAKGRGLWQVLRSLRLSRRGPRPAVQRGTRHGKPAEAAR